MGTKDLIGKPYSRPVRVSIQHKHKMLIKPFILRDQALLLDDDIRVNIVDHDLTRVDFCLSSFHGNMGSKIQ